MVILGCGCIIELIIELISPEDIGIVVSVVDNGYIVLTGTGSTAP